MNESTSRRGRATLLEQQEHLHAFRASGESPTVYCRKNGLKVPTLYRWMKQHQERAVMPPKQAHAFLPVVVQKSSIAASNNPTSTPTPRGQKVCEVDFGPSTRVHVFAGSSQADLSAVFAAITGGRSC